MPAMKAKLVWLLTGCLVSFTSALLLANAAAMLGLDDDFCFTEPLPMGAEDATYYKGNWSFWPPGKICKYYTQTGESRTVVVETRPGYLPLLPLVAGLASPLTYALALRRRRKTAQSSGAGRGGNFRWPPVGTSR